MDKTSKFHKVKSMVPKMKRANKRALADVPLLTAGDSQKLVEETKAEQLVINKRPIIVRDDNGDNVTVRDDSHHAAEPLLVPIKHNVVTSSPTPDNSVPTNTQPAVAATTPTTPQQPPVDDPSIMNSDQALEETTKAIKRERELQEYIKSRQYFVPINTSSKKRSIKISLGLTLVVLILAIVLIDLMLDTGMILLLQKIPHTHFFNTFYNN